MSVYCQQRYRDRTGSLRIAPDPSPRNHHHGRHADYDTKYDEAEPKRAPTPGCWLQSTKLQRPFAFGSRLLVLGVVELARVAASGHLVLAEDQVLSADYFAG